MPGCVKNLCNTIHDPYNNRQVSCPIFFILMPDERTRNSQNVQRSWTTHVRVWQRMCCNVDCRLAAINVFRVVCVQSQDRSLPREPVGVEGGVTLGPWRSVQLDISPKTPHHGRAVVEFSISPSRCHCKRVEHLFEYESHDGKISVEERLKNDTKSFVWHFWTFVLTWTVLVEQS